MNRLRTPDAPDAPDMPDAPNAPATPRGATAALVAVPLAVMLLAMTLLAAAGCTLREPEDPLVEDPSPAQDAPPAVTPTAPPAPPEPEVTTAAIDEEASAGAWRVIVREAEFVERAGDLSAAREGALLLRAEIDVANTTDSALRISPIDFSVTDGVASTFPLSSDDPRLNPSGEIAAGQVAGFTAVFGIPEDKIDSALTLVFEPAEGGPARIEIALPER